MAYQRINWKNEPIEETPLSAENLNHMEDGIVANEEAIEEVSEIVEGKQDTLTFDDVPTKNSNNPVKSNGIYDAILNVLPTDSESGNPCVITNAFNTDAKSVKLTLNPIQSGSGTPSPSNVRPISGRTEANVTRTGKNLLDMNNMTGYTGTPTINNDGSLTVVATSASSVQQVLTGLIPSGTYTITNLSTSKSSYVQIGSGSDYSHTVAYNGGTRTFEYDGTSYLRILFNNQSASTTETYKMQLEFGSTATAYEPYNGESITRTYGTTIYGGSDDVTGEGATKTKDLYVPVVSSVGYSSSAGCNYADCRSITIAEDTETICNMYDQIDHNDTGADGKYKVYPDVITIYDNRFTDVATAQAILDNCQIVYPLATPTSIPLTAQNITLLHGDNVLTTDANSIEASYSADIALYIAKKIAEGSNNNRSVDNSSLTKGGSSEVTEEEKK